MQRADVVVVGAGLAGLTCATGLASRGFRVRVVDAKPSVGHPVHTTGIFVRRTLEDFALPEACLGPALREVIVYSPRGRATRLRSPHDEFRVGRMAPLYRHAAAAAIAAGAELTCATRLLAIRGTAGHLTLELASGEPGTAPRVHEVAAGFVIGADGVGSRVARTLGLARNREWLIGVEEVRRGTSGRPGLHCFLDPALAPGYLAWLVDDGEELHLGVAGIPHRFHPRRALEALRARVGWAGLARTPLLERRGGRIPIGGLVARFAEPRGLLVGDAAGAVSPLTAGGLDPCLRQARLAVEVTAAWLGAGDPAALAAYQGPAVRDRFRGRRLLRRGFALLERGWLIELGCALLRLPPGERAAAQIFFGRGSFPDVDLAAAMAAVRRAELGGAASRWLPGGVST